MVSSSRVDTVLVGNDFPELKIRGEKFFIFFREIKNEMTFESRDRINDDETKLQNSIYKNPIFGSMFKNLLLLLHRMFLHTHD